MALRELDKSKDLKKLNFYIAEELLKDTNEMCEDIGFSYSEAIRKGLKMLIQDWKHKKEILQQK